MKKILIVDDSAFMRNMLKDMILNSSTYYKPILPIDIIEAEDKISAVRQLQKENPDVILLDMVMQNSEVEGLEFIRTVKYFYNTKKIILISSVGNREVMKQCIQENIARYLQKPFYPTDLIAAIYTILNEDFSKEEEHAVNEYV